MSERNNNETESQGLAMHLLELFHRLRRVNRPEPHQMELIETLIIGGKQRLSLVRCGEGCFLVGGNTDGIQTIVPVCADREANTLKTGATKQCA